MKVIHFLSILTVLTVTTILLTSEVCAENVAESILDYLEHGGSFQVGTQKDVVLVLGITSTGKSSLMSLITGAELESIADNWIKGSYRIIDRNSEFVQTLFTLSKRSHSIIESIQTINLMIDERNEVSFYDCFGFDNPKNVKVELAATFALSKLLLFAESVKFLFSVSYDSIEKNNGHDFQDLIRYVIGLIKDIEKYRNAIAIVVTKVPNTFVEIDGQLQLEDDATKIQSLANSLQQKKVEIMQKMSEPTTNEERQTFLRYILIIDILLEKDDSSYKRIGIMRLPDRAGPLSKMPLIQSEKSNVLKIVNENLQYIPKKSNDFRYVISDKSRAHINDVANMLRTKLTYDFYEISVDMRIFILQKEKISSISLNESIITTSMIESNLSKIDSMEPKQFLEQLTETIDTLGATVPIKHLNNFSKNIFYLNFVQLFSTNNFTIPTEIFNEIAEERDYLNISQKWYNFLIELHEKLSTFRVQKQKNDYDGSKIMYLAKKGKNIGQMARDLDIKSTIDRIDPQIYEQIHQANAYISFVKLKLLQGVWEQSMQPASKNCSTNGEQLTVHGYNVLISDVIQSVCWPQAKHIEIFALNKVFFDANIEKTAIYLSIISPTWEIMSPGNVTNRQIKLIGADGLNYSAPAANGIYLGDWDVLGDDGEDLNDNLSKGKNGLPGVSGGQGGQFFGIDSVWTINENRLEILVNGGKGGDGQDGGHGVNGRDGEDVPETDDYLKLDALGFRCGGPTSVSNGKFYTVEHKFCGTPAIAGTDGGNGGCKGSGGKKGLVQVYGPANRSNIISIEQSGQSGKDGKGGLAGKGAKNGRDFHIKIKYHATVINLGMPGMGVQMHPEENRKMWYDDTGTKPAGKNGTDDGNCYEIGEKNFNFYNSLKSLRQYKYFARMHLTQNVQMSDLTGFLDHLETNAAIKSLFSTIELIEEFETMDKFFNLRNKFSFIAYYERLRDRIAAYSRTTAIGKDEEKALNYLYTAVSSRLFAIKSHSNRIGIVNLYEYMKIVEKRMIKLQQVKRTVYINEYRDEFKGSLNIKIEAANKVVQKTVVAGINNMFTQVGEKIKELLTETSAMENEVHDQTGKSEENKKTLKTKMIAGAILKSVNIVALMLAGLGPAGMVAGTVIGSGACAAEKAINATLKMHTITVSTGLVKSNVLRVAEQAKHDFQLLKLQLGDLRTILQNSNLSDFTAILKTINLSTIKMEKVTENSEIPGIDSFEFLDETRKNLTSLIEDAKKRLESFGDSENRLVKFAKESLYFMEQLLRVGEAGLEVYQQIHEGKKKIAEVDETIRELDDQLKTIKQHEKNIYNVMIPQFKMVEQSVSEAIHNSAGKSHCELVISQWTVQKSLDKVKRLFKSMAQGFTVGKDLEDCLDRIDVGITTVINVYDRIDAYTEKAQLAELIADIAIGSNEITDRKLRDAIFKMDAVINANLAMEQYEMAMYALKQHKFPFADQYLGQFELPSNYSTTDTEFTNSAINQISELVLKIRESKSLIERIDGYLYNNHHFVNHEAFFKWDRFNYKNEINNLLSGEETTFVADIKSGSKLNAVKFNEVWLKFKMKNDTVQKQFDAEFPKFSVVMQMVGNNFYRCANRIYYISLENPFLISYSLKNGKVSSPNQVYGKLATGDTFLSPYSTWRISLRSKTDKEFDFKRLRQFRSYIKEIALEGRGQFFDNRGEIVYETCNDQLNKYYRLDSVTSFGLFH